METPRLKYYLFCSGVVYEGYEERLAELDAARSASENPMTEHVPIVLSYDEKLTL